MKIIETNNYEEMSRKAANIIFSHVILKSDSVLGLATGSTPIGIYKQLVKWYNKGDLDFSQVTTINLDEYVGIALTNPQSYRCFMNENFFNYVNIPKEHTFVPNGNAKDLELECTEYDSLIERANGIDLQLLGIGHNGHIGFNEPDIAFEKTTHIVSLGTSTIQANARFFSSIEEVPKMAITLGIKAIMQAKKILLVANGTDKEGIIQKALYGPITPSVPASILQLHPDLTVVSCFNS